MKVRLIEGKEIYKKYRVDVVSNGNKAEYYGYKNGHYYPVNEKDIPKKILDKISPINMLEQPDTKSKDWKDAEKERKKNSARKETKADREAALKKIGELVQGKSRDELKNKFGPDAYKGDTGADISYDPRYGVQFATSHEQIKNDLKYLIGSQCDKYKEVRYSTYSKINKKTANRKDIIKPGAVVEDELLDWEMPVLNVYYDQSGSWGQKDLDQGDALLADLRRDYVDIEEPLLQINTFYFAHTLGPDPDAVGCGNTDNIRLIGEHILENNPKNVLIMTDSDANWGYDESKGPRVRIEGVCYQVYRQGSVADKMLKAIVGDPTLYYKLNW